MFLVWLSKLTRFRAGTSSKLCLRRKAPRWSSGRNRLVCELLEDRALPSTFAVTNINDDGAGSFRQAILDANANAGLDTINFSIGAGSKTIALLSPLPTITSAVSIDATTQPGFTGAPLIELDGSGAGASANGLFITAGSSTVKGLVINRFSSDGIELTTNGGNLIQGNTIALNGGAGIIVGSGAGNSLRQNAVYSNNGLGIDLGAPGVTPNDAGDADTGPNNLQNDPVLSLARPGASTRVAGLLNSTAGATFILDFYANDSADSSGNGEGQRYLGSISATTQTTGNLSFDVLLPTGANAGEWITATATDALGNTSEFSTAVKANSLPPTLLVSGPDAVAPGSPYTLNLSASDPEGVAITSWTINWGDGSSEVIPGNPSTASHTYTQNATRTISATATDSEGTYTAYVKTLGSNSAPLPAGAVSWWKGENSGADSIGSNNVSLFNGATFSTGRVGQAFNFDGVNDGAQGADATSLKLTSLSIEGWIIIQGFPSEHGEILFRGDDRGGFDPYFLATSPSGKLTFGVYDKDNNISRLDASIASNQFVHVAATYDQATGLMTLYLNGALAIQTSSTIRTMYDLSAADNPAFGIGNHGGAPSTPHNFPFNGRIDELTLYGRALTSSEIQTIVAADSAGKFKPTVTSFNVTVQPIAVATATTLTATPNASTGGQLVTFTATVAPSPGNLGTVTFRDNAAVIAANVSVTGGVAVLQISSLSVGSHPIRADHSGAAGFASSMSNTLNYVVSAPTSPRVVSVTPNGNIPVLAGAQRSRVASLVVVFDQPVLLDADAMTLALHTTNVRFGGAAQPSGFGTLPTSLVLNTTDNKTWTVAFSGNTDNGADGFHSLKDGVYDLKIGATKVHPIGAPGVSMTANSTTTFHRLFGDTDAAATPTGGTAGVDFAATVNTGDNLAFRNAFNKPEPDYKSYFDFDGNGTIITGDNLQFRSRFNKALSWSMPVGTIIETGFNDASGINGNGTPNSPYALGPVHGNGAGEPGWSTPWLTGGASLIQSAVVFEGDNALRVVPTSLPQRAWATPATDVLTIEQRVRFDSGARVVAYSQTAGSGEGSQGAVWTADGTRFYVLDGHRNGSGSVIDTNLRWVPGTWYDVKSVIDVKNGGWEFYVNGVPFAAGRPLGFRGTPNYLDTIRYLSEGSGSAYVDAIRITVTPE
jgi:parallel beta-helix repeat protein